MAKAFGSSCYFAHLAVLLRKYEIVIELFYTINEICDIDNIIKSQTLIAFQNVQACDKMK